MSDIASVNLRTLDLNLLVILAAVLEERNVTRAAGRLHLTQGAVSSALKRAAALFPGPLHERRPHGLQLTPLGEAVLPELRAWLQAGRLLLAAGPAFDPGCTPRRFVLACTDAVAITVLPGLLRALQLEAPHASLDVVTIDRAREGLERGAVDLLVGMPRGLGPAFHEEPLYDDPYVCLVRKERPALPLAQYAALPHVELALFGEPDRAVDHALAGHGLTRHVRAALPHFTSLAVAALELDGVVTLGRRLAERFAAWHPGLHVLPAPVALPPLPIRTVWHRRADHDPAVAFLRTLLRRATADGSPWL